MNMSLYVIVVYDPPCFLSIYFHVVDFSRCMHMHTGPNIHVHEFCLEFSPGTGPPIIGFGKCAIELSCIVGL